MALKLTVPLAFGPSVSATFWRVGSFSYEYNSGAIQLCMYGYPDAASATASPPVTPIMTRSYSVNASVLPTLSIAAVLAYVQTLPDWAGATTVADPNQGRS